MQIKISARHGHLSDSHQQEIHQKADKLLHFFERLTMIEVTVDLADRLHKKVEVKLDAEHKHDLVALAEHEDLMTAVDLAIDKSRHQLNKYKEKIQEKR